MTSQLTIVDYGSGNLRSASRALDRAVHETGADVAVTVTRDPDTVAHADRVVLPGVGAFADCRGGIIAIDGMDEALAQVVRWKARPFLGICVGMQLLATTGHEHGRYDGFGWIPGDVVALEDRKRARMDETAAQALGLGRRLKSPHMGWNVLDVTAQHPLLADLPAQDGGPHAYFVHSYCFETENPAHSCATTDYGGPITAFVAKDTVAGTQFHPEKSQAVGLTLLKNFLTWSP